MMTTLEMIDQISEHLSRWHQNFPDRAEINTLRRELELLEYMVTEVPAWTPSIPSVTAPVCTEPGCKATWREGLINYSSQSGEGFDAVWFCTEHAVGKMQDQNKLPPPGTPPSENALLARAREMAGRWNALLAKLDPPKTEAKDA